MTKPTSAATATRASPTASVPLFGTGAKLIARMRAATRTTDRMPPGLSTGSGASLTWAGANMAAIGQATTTRGRGIRKTDPQSKCSSNAPATSGPSDPLAPPSADQAAFDFGGPGPAHRAALSASVVGYAMPAHGPPSPRAPKSATSLGANEASRQSGTESAMPRGSIALRP